MAKISKLVCLYNELVFDVDNSFKLTTNTMLSTKILAIFLVTATVACFVGVKAQDNSGAIISDLVSVLVRLRSGFSNPQVLVNGQGQGEMREFLSRVEDLASDILHTAIDLRQDY
ncbi:uncharacterized protein LOC142225451 [Haematobia irritans]|uniref:uncharacterized protein LOC142225451 n=1 Tax=Haematobia irritans TaxID=7368 RepID=UPI003F5036F0